MSWHENWNKTANDIFRVSFIAGQKSVFLAELSFSAPTHCFFNNTVVLFCQPGYKPSIHLLVLLTSTK